MDELVKLIDELSMALKSRVEAGIETQKLAQEVLAIPKLSALAPHLGPVTDRIKNNLEIDNGANAMVRQLEQQLELQNLEHVEQQALETLAAANQVVSQIRQGLNEYVSLSDQKCASLIKEYNRQILEQKDAISQIHQQNQDLVFRMSRKSALVEKLFKNMT